jgi:Zn-dependent protease with chaperone function
MEVSLNNYPPAPTQVDPKITQPSKAYKSEVVKVSFSILFFIIVYFLLVLAAIGLALLSAFGGVSLIVAVPKFVTLMLGLGLIGLGIMVIFFLIKFIFTSNVTDRSGLIEITEENQPRLFEFIRKLTEETKAPFPKKIYLSPDVNACVFYDSSFWSMFFPVKKNLQIGLGLVNSVNMSEFKAILAHEFGHFSQDSMKLGSYVYNVNRVIYNMLYENEGYGNAITRWANISNYFAIFAQITVKIVQGVQWILQKVYAVVNIRYMSLSRQMEFHADSIAAAVSGGNHLVTSLRRIEVADHCYNTLIEHHDNWFKENLKSQNFYPCHSRIMTDYAEDFNIPLKNNLPVVEAHTFSFYNKNRISVKDQWASHPSTDDRENHLKTLGLETDTIHEPAWEIFDNYEKLQREMTAKIYEPVKFAKTPEEIDYDLFCSKYQENKAKYSLHKFYRGYYNSRDIKEFDLEVQVSEPRLLVELLSDEMLNLPILIQSIQVDLQTLEAIAMKGSGISTFDFAGQKHKRQDTTIIQEQLKKEMEEHKLQLVRNDQQLFAYFISEMNDEKEVAKLKTLYSNYFHSLKEIETCTNLIEETINLIAPLYNGQVDERVARQIIGTLKQKEVIIKTAIKRVAENHKDLLSAGELEKANQYVNSTYNYLDDLGFNDYELTQLHEALGLYSFMLQEGSFNVKKEMLDLQVASVFEKVEK